MPSIILLLFIVIIIYVIIKLFMSYDTEGFDMYQTYQSVIPWSNGYTNFPWWNTPLGTTKNMSYDLRGDPLVIPRTQFVWNNSSLFPIYNKSI